MTTAGTLAAACAAGTPIVIEKEVIKEVEVEKPVVVKEEVVKEVVKEVPVEKVVEKEVIKEVPVEKVVEKEVEKIVTPTPLTPIRDEQLSLRIGDTGQLKELFMWDKIVEQFPNWDLRLEEAPWGQYMDKIYVQLAGGTAPDMFFFGNGELHNWIDRDVFLGLMPFMERDKIDMDRFTADPRLGAGRHGEAYGLQQCIGDMPAWICNVAAFEEAGIDLPPHTWEDGYDELTYEDEIEMSLALTKRRADGTTERFGKLNPGSIGHGWENYIWGNGGDFLDTPWDYINPTECLIDSPEVIEATQHMVDLTYKYKVTPTPAEAEEATGLEGFFSERVAIQHYWVQWSLLKEAPFPIAVYWFPCPQMKVGTHYICHVRTIPKATKHPDAAWEVLKYTHLDPENLRLLARKFRQPYDTWTLIGELTDPGQIEAEKVVLSHLFPGDMSNQRPWGYGNLNGQKVRDTITSMIEAIMLQDVGVEDGLRTAKQEIDRLLDEARQD
jgi:multiple sugar transport system substrate-binding protein